MDPGYTWTLKADSLFLRAFKWLWGARPSNFCLLFWGVIFSPIALIGCCIIRPIVQLWLLIDEHTTLSPRDRDTKRAKRATAKARREAHPSLGIRFLERVAAFLDKIAAFFQHRPMIGKLVRFISLAIALMVAACAIIAAVWAFVWGWEAHALAMEHFFEVFGLIIAGALVALGIATLFVYWIGDWGGDDFFIAIGHGIRCVFRFFMTAYHMVKDRTCPRIIVK